LRVPIGFNRSRHGECGYCEPARKRGRIPVIASASASEREAIQGGRVPAVDSGLLRRLRRLAMTVPHSRHCERERKRARSNPELGSATR